MNGYSDRLLLFPRVNEARLNQQKLEKTFEIRHRIMAQLKRNKTASLYNLHDGPLEASFSLGRKKSPERECGKAYPRKKKSVSENLSGLSDRGIVVVSFQGHSVSGGKIKRTRLFFDGQSPRNNDCELQQGQERMGKNRKYLRIKTEGKIEDHQASLRLPSSPPHNLKPTINIKSIQGTINEGTHMQKSHEHKYFKQREKLKRYYHKVSRPNQPERNRLKQIQLKFTLLHGWKTDQQDCKLFT